jgi:hypothetical protein
MKTPEEELVEILRRLPAREQTSLLDFARYLGERAAEAAPAEVPLPLDIPRPDQESVVKAMQRLSATYPMVEKSRLLNEATGLMSQHVLEGRDANEVIDEMEALFRAHYERLLEEWGGAD